jgi:hypothetical protein
MDFAQRAGRNEEIFREINEKIEQGVEQHGVASPVEYHCECASASCFETISLRPSEYERVAGERYRFVIVPGHETGEFEQVVERHEDYLIVEKIGEAREQIDRDHPWRRHS